MRESVRQIRWQCVTNSIIQVRDHAHIATAVDDYSRRGAEVLRSSLYQRVVPRRPRPPGTDGESARVAERGSRERPTGGCNVRGFAASSAKPCKGPSTPALAKP